MYTQNRNRLTDAENKLVTKGEREGGGANQGYGIKRDNLLCIKQISNKNMLYSTGNYSHYLVINFNGVQSVKILNHYAIHLKLYFNLKKRDLLRLVYRILGADQENPKSIRKGSLGFGAQSEAAIHRQNFFFFKEASALLLSPFSTFWGLCLIHPHVPLLL